LQQVPLRQPFGSMFRKKAARPTEAAALWFRAAGDTAARSQAPGTAFTDAVFS
jgi:hypothetical protein